MLSDPIADLLTRLRNASRVKHNQVVVPYSKLKHDLVKILVKEAYLKDVSVSGKKPQEKMLQVGLKHQKGRPAITGIKRISKPGVRRYVKYQGLSRLLLGRGTTLISTSRVLMTARQAQKAKLGGEIICKIN